MTYDFESKKKYVLRELHLASEVVRKLKKRQAAAQRKANRGGQHATSGGLQAEIQAAQEMVKELDDTWNHLVRKEKMIADSRERVKEKETT